MSRRIKSRADRVSPFIHTRPELERLEDRCLLNADPLNLVASTGPAIESILVGYTDGSSAVVQLEGADLSAALAQYKAAEGVAYAEPDYQVHIAVIPNDPSFGQLYGLHNTGQVIQSSTGVADADIDAAEAWDQFSGRKGSTSITVGIIDSGIDYTHQDLYLNVWINQDEIPSAIRSNLADVDSDGLITFYDLNNSANIGVGKITDLNGNSRIDGGDILRTTAQGGWADGIDQDSFTTRGITYNYIDDLVGWNFVNNTNNPFDDNGHGTHVAGTIGAIGNNGVGITGINWVSQMAGLKFLSASGSGSTSGAVSAIDYAVGNGMRLTNNSWGGGGYSSTLEAAIRNARDANQLFIAAAGNSASNNDVTASYPSNYNLANVVAVAATDNRDALASFSSYGATTVDLAAPGVNILSTTPNNTYSYFSGTSMATPHVAGAAALILAKDPTLTYSQVISRITGNVDVISTLNGRVATSGRLNANKALPGTPPPSDTSGARLVTASILGSQTAVTGLQVTFSEDITQSTFTTADLSFSGFNPSATVSLQYVNARTYNVNFGTTLAQAGNYSVTVGPNINDLANNAMNQNQNSFNGEAADAALVTFTVTSPPQSLTFTNNTAANIRDLRTTSSTIVINQDGTIADLNVKVSATHTWVGDLRIQLRAPDGTTVRLFTYRGGSGDNLTGTTFDDGASTSISAGAAPFNGTYRPEALLSAFNGKNIRGNWTLQVYDGASGDVGTLTSWSLTVSTGNGPASFAVGAGFEQAVLPPLEIPAATFAGAGLDLMPVSESVTFTAPAPIASVVTFTTTTEGVSDASGAELAFALASGTTRSESRETQPARVVEEEPLDFASEDDFFASEETEGLGRGVIGSSDDEGDCDEAATDALFVELVETLGA